MFTFDLVCGREPAPPWLFVYQILEPGVIHDAATGEPVDPDDRGWTTTSVEGSLPAGSTFEGVIVLSVPLDEDTGEPVCAPDKPAWLFIDDAWAFGFGLLADLGRCRPRQLGYRHDHRLTHPTPPLGVPGDPGDPCALVQTPDDRGARPRRSSSTTPRPRPKIDRSYSAGNARGL